MGKLVYAHEGTFHIRDLLLPTVTLGFYGLRRFRPRWLYTLIALLFLALWLGAAFVAGARYEGGELFVVPFIFFMAAVTFFRLLPQPPGRAGTHR